NEIFLAQFSPLRLAQHGLRGTPELVEALAKAPMLINEGLRFLESTTQRPQASPLSGLRPTLLAGSCIIAAAILIAFGSPWFAWAPLIGASVVFAIWRRD